MTAKAEATKARILSAATDEFAANGFAGARVDQIAAAAGCNKQLIYAYFGSKQGLFDALAEMHVRAVLDTVPIDAHHLPEYAARLYDYNQSHPQLVRLVGWFALEGMQSPLLTRLSVESMAHKIQAIQAAQAAGAIHSALPAEDLLTIVLSISNAWELGLHSAPSAAEDDAQTAQTRRAAIVEAVRKLVE